MGILALAIDTSTDILSVAAGKFPEGVIICEFNLHSHHSHTRNIASLVHLCLAEMKARPEDIGVLGISGGPGSFTGLRIGFSFIKALSYSLKIPVVVVPTDYAVASFVNKMYGGRCVITIIPGKGNQNFMSLFNENLEIISNTDKIMFPFHFYPEHRIKGKDWGGHGTTYALKYHQRNNYRILCHSKRQFGNGGQRQGKSKHEVMVVENGNSRNLQQVLRMGNSNLLGTSCIFSPSPLLRNKPVIRHFAGSRETIISVYGKCQITLPYPYLKDLIWVYVRPSASLIIKNMWKFEKVSPEDILSITPLYRKPPYVQM